MLSLFLLWPTGSTRVWCWRWWEPAFGLGSASELPGVWRVAARGATHHRSAANRDQQSFRAPRHRGTQMARDYAQLRSVLVAAFNSNDFDAFELHLRPLPEIRTVFGKAPATFTGASSLTCRNFQPALVEADFGSGDNLEAALAVPSSFTVSTAGAIFNSIVNLLTSEFPAISPTPLERVLTAPDALVPAAAIRLTPAGRESLTSRMEHLQEVCGKSPRESCNLSAPCLRSRVRMRPRWIGAFADCRIQLPDFLKESGVSRFAKNLTLRCTPALTARKLGWCGSERIARPPRTWVRRPDQRAPGNESGRHALPRFAGNEKATSMAVARSSER